MPIISSTTQFITLDEVKAQANVPLTDASHDAELTRFQLAAQEHVESLVGPVVPRAVTETARASGGMVILSRPPVVSVESLTSNGQAVTYTLNSGAGLLTGVTAGGELSVSYTAGRSPIPEAIRVAALIIAEHLWKTQLGNVPSALPTEEFTTAPFGLGYAIPNRAIELLAPYLLAPGIA